MLAPRTRNVLRERPWSAVVQRGIPQAPPGDLPGHGAPTSKHRAGLSARTFDEPAARASFLHCKVTIECRKAETEGIEADLAGFFDAGPFAAAVGRLAADRGVGRLGALVLQAEVCYWRRFSGREDAGAGRDPRPGVGHRGRALPALSFPFGESTRAAWSSPRSPGAWSATSRTRWSLPEHRLAVRPLGPRTRPPVTELFLTRRGAARVGTHAVASLCRPVTGSPRQNSGARSCELQTCVATAREHEIGGDRSTQSAPARHEDPGARSPPLRVGSGPPT